MEYNGKSYDQWHKDTVTYTDPVYPVLGLGGEVGETLELIKKEWRESEEKWPETIDKTKLMSELGDIIWYVTRIAHLSGFSLDQVLIGNIRKLEHRQKYGKSTDNNAAAPEVQEN